MDRGDGGTLNKKFVIVKNTHTKRVHIGAGNAAGDQRLADDMKVRVTLSSSDGEEDVLVTVILIKFT